MRGAGDVMTEPGWGVGVPSSVGSAGIGALAAAAEGLGYQTFWFNCVGPDASPAAVMEAALATTHRITIGVGVVPLSVYPVVALAGDLARRGCDDRRVLLGIGSGPPRAGSLDRVRQGLLTLREALPLVRLCVGTASPRMLAVAAELADAVLLSMTPLAKAAAVQAALRDAGGTGIAVDRYHRVGVGPGAATRGAAEMVTYGLLPPGGSPPPASELLGSVVVDATDARSVVRHDLGEWPVGWGHVLRPLPADPADVGELRHLLEVLAPG